MKYVKMSIEEANKLIGKNVEVLVSVQDLEKDKNEVIEFTRKTKVECELLIEKSETIARVYDDFINQLRVFSCRQIDVINFEPHGKLSTILLKE